jgi:hypothetical protein
MTFGVIPFLGNPVFDYFFTIVFVSGLIAVGPSMLFKLFRY